MKKQVLYLLGSILYSVGLFYYCNKVSATQAPTQEFSKQLAVGLTFVFGSVFAEVPVKKSQDCSTLIEKGNTIDPYKLKEFTLLVDGGARACDLSGVDLNGADLSYIDFNGFTGSMWEDPFFYGGRWFFAQFFGGPNLSHADLSHTDLTYATLLGAKLFGAIIKFANLNFADFRYADLREADLRGVTFIRTKFKGADLRGALVNEDLGFHLKEEGIRGFIVKGMS